MAARPGRIAPTGLPVEESVDAVRSALRDAGVVVLQAQPGAGKTTVVPLRLLGEDWLGAGRIVVLEPRRVAARAAARRMAELLGEEVGATVGYTTRGERRVGPATQIEVVTDGVLTRRLQRQPGLPGIGLVIFDEFHERHLQADVGLALTLDVRSGLRPDLRVAVMSATVDTAAVAALLGGAPVVISEGRAHPVAVHWSPPRPAGRLGPMVASTVAVAVERHRGDVLVFLPGVGEIDEAARALRVPEGMVVDRLHGNLPSAEQDRVLLGGAARRIVLSTDLAETSVTVEGVAVVVDAGLARRPAYDAASGLSRLRTAPASRASADQRAGRAGRHGPGHAYRMWDEHDHAGRRAWPDPEIVSADLAELVLELAVWGARPDELRWLDPPPAAALGAASRLLEELGAISGGRPTPLGRRLVELPTHPRLGRMVLAAGPADREAASLLAAMLGERDILARGARRAAGSVDAGARLALLQGGPGSGEAGGVALRPDRAAVAAVRERARELVERSRTAGEAASGRSRRHPPDAGGLLAEAYPDRLAQARGNGRFRLRHGGGAALPEQDPLRDAEWLVVADVDAPGGTGRADGRIRMAAAIDRNDVVRVGGPSVATEVALEWDEQADDLRAVTRTVLDELVLGSVRGSAPEGPATTAALVQRAVDTDLAVLRWGPAARALQARAGWARRALGDDWPDLSDAVLADDAAHWLAPQLERATRRDDLERVDVIRVLRAALGGRSAELDRLVPESLELASGRRVAIDYSGDRPRVAVRVQHLYGTDRHPTVAGGRLALTIEVLSPAGRPVQVTADLPGFWAGSWAEVRREMAGRYPKHDWPADPGRPGTAASARRPPGPVPGPAARRGTRR